MNTLKTLAAATIAITAAALPLGAASAGEARTATISYEDLNLSSQAGQDILDRRIENAVEAVCGRLQGRPTFDSAVRECQTQTRLTAMQSRDIAVASYGRTQLAGNPRASRQIRLVAR